MADITGAIGRLSALKAFINISASADDAFLKNCLRSSTQAFETECARKFILQDFTAESYTAQRDQRRLYLANWPVLALTEVKYGDTVQSATSYTLLSAADNPYLIRVTGNFDIPGQSVDAPAFPQGDGYIKLTYQAGYDNSGWASLGLEVASGDSFNVPNDIETAIIEYAAVLWYNSRKSGAARLGIASSNRGVEGAAYERYETGYPSTFRAAINKYRRLI